MRAIQNEDGEFVPKIKISENVEKITNPGNKTIYRIYDKETGKMRADLICFVGEEYDTFKRPPALRSERDMEENAPRRRHLYDERDLKTSLHPRRMQVQTLRPVQEIADHCRQEKETLWDETKRLFNPHKVYVDLSQKLYDTKTEL